MSLPCLDRPICEPVELAAGARMRLRRIEEGENAAPNAPFPHYHDVCELVLFGAVRGHVDLDGIRYPLSPGCAVFVPSLAQHDFALAAGARDWHLVQVDAALVTALAGGAEGVDLRTAFCATPGRVARDRIAMLARWLLESGHDARLAEQVARTLLLAAAAAPRAPGRRLHLRGDTLRRLRPAIEQLRRDPAHAPSAEQAAALCALSPAYFSRRFHQQLGMPWSDYVRAHRLHLACQRLLESRRSVASIAGDLGFASPSHFGELFQRRFGVTPHTYRRKGR